MQSGSVYNLPIRMRRSTAIALLLLILAAFLAPAALATATKPLPACCRASGPHHCSTVVPSGGIKVQGQSCPYRKHLAFTGSVAPPPAAHRVAPGAARSVSGQFHPQFFISRREAPHSQRAPPLPSSVS